MTGKVKLQCGEPPPTSAVCRGRCRGWTGIPGFKRAAASCADPSRRGIAIVHPPQVEHHQWQSPPPSPPRGLAPLDASTRLLLRQLRERRARTDPRLRGLALGVVLALHVLFVAVVWREMRPSAAAPPRAAHAESVLAVRFIGRAPEPAAPPPIPPPLPARVRLPPKPHAGDAISLQMPVPVPSQPRLFDRDGQPLLPAASATTAPAAVPGYVQHLPAGDPRIMRNPDIIKYRPTRFEGDWDSGGNAADSALQKLVDKTTVRHTFHLPGGVRIHCAVFPLAGGCSGDPPPPPSAKDGDERLSMAPAKLLAADPHPPPPPALAACIAMYRAGQPLAWGCPVDTPDRAVDDELRQRAAATAGHR